jgi:membrane protein
MATSDDSHVRRQSSSDVSDAPHPDDPRKPDSPTELGKPAWKFALKRALAEFSSDECTDLAAALTYYSVLSLFPAAIALISLLGVFGQGPSTINALLGILQDVGAGGVTSSVRGPLLQLSQNQAAGLGLVLGLATALWSASGYVGAFGRAMNRIYEIGEGRPFWKLRPLQILITLIAVILIALVAVSLVVSGPLAEAIGKAIGLSGTLVTVWNIVKWPVLAGIVVLIIAILYYATPNVKQPKFRWMSLGAFTALIVWVIASAAFGFYVANFGSYNKTYGTLAGVIVFLLWLWITNLALLFGAEVDSEIERSRQLQAGMRAEDDLQLPPRDDKGLKKKAEKEEKARAEAREIRQNAE